MERTFIGRTRPGQLINLYSNLTGDVKGTPASAAKPEQWAVRPFEIILLPHASDLLAPRAPSSAYRYIRAARIF
jgi:hypothetical protein